MALLTLGGALKRRESLSARLGDMLSELYFASAVLKRFEDDGRHDDDVVLVQWCCDASLARIETALDGFIRNFPNRPLAALLRVVTLPWGVREHGPTDAVTHACAELLMQRGAARERITGGVFRGCRQDGIERVERAFVLVHEVAPLARKARCRPGHERRRGGGPLTLDEAAREAGCGPRRSVSTTSRRTSCSKHASQPLPRPRRRSGFG